MTTDTGNDAAEYSEWMGHMRRGDYDAAWCISDRILAASGATSHLKAERSRIWNGEPIVGRRVLVHCNHGLGDTIQFARFLPWLASLAAELDVSCERALFDLMRSMACVDHLHDHSATLDTTGFVEIEVMELAHFFRVTTQTLPNTVPYVFSDISVHHQQHQRIRIGLVWESGIWDDRRSLPFGDLVPIFGIESIDAVILQLEPESAGWTPGYGHVEECDTIPALARTMKTLDLVISVDTMSAHLAGALGVPVWTLLHSRPDWRWPEDTDRTPWYPTMTVFTQKEPGAWKPVIENVVRGLRVHLASTPQATSHRGALSAALHPFPASTSPPPV